MKNRRFSLEQIEDADHRMCGFCVVCGEERECCEPDARKYPCEECETPTVYGAQELAIMGLVE